MDASQRDAEPDTLLLNVAIIPPDNIDGEAIALSREARSLGGIFELDGKSRRPHVTIYMARFSQSKVATVVSTLSKVLPILQKQLLIHSGYYLTSSGYYEASYTKTSELVSIHENITEELHKFRHSPGYPVVEDYFGVYAGKTKSNVENWGYDLIGNLYRPHMTLTRFPSAAKSSVQQASLPTSKHDLSFTLTRIGIFQADNMGSARKLISSFELA